MLSERELEVRRKLLPLEARARAAAYPIYGTAGRRTRLLGSGFFLAVGENLMLVTATHVLDERDEYELFLPTLQVDLPQLPVVAADRETADVAVMLLPPNVF